MKKFAFIFILFFVCLACQLHAQVNTAWAKSMGGDSFDLGQLVEADGSGNVYTLGAFQNTADFDPSGNVFNLTAQGLNNTFLQKLDANGNFVWVKHIGISPSVLISAMSVTNAGDIYIAGSTSIEIDIDPDINNTVLITGFFVLKLNSSGNFVWVKTLPSNILNNSYHVDVDSFGNVYVVGSFSNTVDFDPSPADFFLTSIGLDDIFIQKFDSNGNFLWAKAFGGASQDLARGLKIDATNNIYIVGRFMGTVDFDPNADVFNVSTGICFVEKLNSDGDFVWVRTFGPNAQGAANDVSSRDITVDSNNNPLIIGQYSGTQDFDPGTGIVNLTSNPTQIGTFILKLSNMGNFSWVKGTNVLSPGFILPRKIVTDNTNAIYLAGTFNSSADFDYGAGTYILNTGAVSDGFIQKLDNNGNFLWVKGFGEVPTSETVSGLFVDSNQFVYFTGNFYQTVNFDINACTSINITSVGQSDAFVVKLAPISSLPVVSYEPTPTVLSPFVANCLASPAQSFQVKGENLWGNLIVNVPVNYEMSLTSNGVYTSSVSFPPNCGTVLPTTIFIRLKGGLTVGTYNNFVTLSSTGATSKNLPVAGTVVATSGTANIALADSYCLSVPIIPLSATPTGGTFTINNIAATHFNASTLGTGSHTVKYTYTDINGCTNTATKTVIVNSLPTLSNNVILSYSTNQASFTIVGTPAGGTFTIAGNSITVFNPATLGAGSHTLVHTYTDANGCSNSLIKIISITEPPTLTNTAGATCWANQNISVDANMTVTGATSMTGAIVSFGAGYVSTQDRLVYPITLHGITGTFNVATGVLKLMGTATTAQYQEVLRSIQYQNIAGTGYGTTKNINFTVGDVLPFYPCGSSDAHFYKFISASAITWQNAKIAAESQNYFGMQGYLATISCSEENSFAFNSIAQRGWIGASDDNAFTNMYSPNGEGQWYWVTGPEKGTRFWQGNQPGTPVNGLYNNWEAGEPNNYQNTNESFAHLLENGRWNDYVFNNSSILGYYIEFGGLPTDPAVLTTSTKQIQLATKLDFAINTKYCIDANEFTLFGTPTGGTFKINGNVHTTFNPALLGVGTHQVSYELAGCTISAVKSVEVKPLPTVSITGLQASYCANDLPIVLAGLPTGGTFTINGTTATQFNPTTLGAGEYVVKYSYQDANFCQNSTTQNVTIHALPTVSITGLQASYCISQASFALQASPVGGSFTINNINTTSFEPNVLGAGIHEVAYTYTNAQGCAKTITQSVNVQPLPALSFVNVPDEYCSKAISFVLQASPAGGTFTVNGVNNSTFNPASFNIGDVVEVKYTYTDANTCTNSIVKTVEIIFSSGYAVIDEPVNVCPFEANGYPLEAISLSEEATLKAANGNLLYEWSNGSTSRTIFIKEEADAGDYTVKVKNEVGCPLRDITYRVTIDCKTAIFLPNVFTPNGDGLNDTWKILGGDFTKLDLRVYNRWGELIYVARSKEDAWDGKINGKPAPEGVYAWTASYENPLKKGIITIKQGTVSIIR